ncbi:histidine kinase dimerization/phosphoacceptor domain -containing protein [Nostoc sp. FACHB-110]|uniref:PAS domain-containing sensor histidine kinase n=1 Tax=Nostoc sp. FACHB-110 TaxID=2692834 RepID=UPI00168928BE|nr:histidine kinase dimerization/phosphoacceptor domain -containing protein [Nostoc sp. FACHB-110]MBD2437900.1 GAF domain-containing protein [Nostoc sp. FACHB-110]
MQENLVFTYSPLPILIYDPDKLQVLNVNQAAVNKYAYSKAEFLQMQITDLYVAECRPQFLEIIAQNQQNLSFNSQSQHLCKDGQIIDVSLATHSIEYESRNAHLVYIQDITDIQASKHNAQDREVEYQKILAAIPSPSMMSQFSKLTEQKNLATNLKETEKALKSQLERERLIRNVMQRIHKSLNLQDILNTIVEEVRYLLQVERVIVYQFAADMSGTVVAESLEPGWKQSLDLQIEDTCFQEGAGIEYAQGRKRAIANIYEAGLTDCHIQLLEQFEVKANLVVPILLEVADNNVGRLWGLLVAHQCSQPREWEEHQLDLLDQLSVTIAIAIQQSTIFQQAQNELAERQKAEIQLRNALAEKEVLLKEVHHRVKNNLQIISSLLQLQSHTLKDPEVIKIFRESQNRIDSICLIHKNLYTVPNIGQLDVVDYIENLATSIMISYQLGPERINLLTNVESVSLNLDQAIACGLVINELISNSLKHAFPNAENGTISINLHNLGNNIEMMIQDDGIGIPDDLDWNNTESLGLSLVYDLVTEQLEGSITLERNHGTVFKIQFPQLMLQ